LDDASGAEVRITTKRRVLQALPEGSPEIQVLSPTIFANPPRTPERKPGLLPEFQQMSISPHKGAHSPAMIDLTLSPLPVLKIK
jgi:hypothetical protein